MSIILGKVTMKYLQIASIILAVEHKKYLPQPVLNTGYRLGPAYGNTEHALNSVTGNKIMLSFENKKYRTNLLNFRLKKTLNLRKKRLSFCVRVWEQRGLMSLGKSTRFRTTDMSVEDPRICQLHAQLC